MCNQPLLLRKIYLVITYVFGSSLVWTCQISNLKFGLFFLIFTTTLACRKQQQIFKIWHVQIDELPRTSKRLLDRGHEPCIKKILWCTISLIMWAVHHMFLQTTNSKNFGLFSSEETSHSHCRGVGSNSFLGGRLINIKVRIDARLIL